MGYEQIRMEDLLQAQFDNEQNLLLFDGVASFSINMLIHQINKSESSPFKMQEVRWADDQNSTLELEEEEGVSVGHCLLHSHFRFFHLPTFASARLYSICIARLVVRTCTCLPTVCKREATCRRSYGAPPVIVQASKSTCR
jgi:hypothetical protein